MITLFEKYISKFNKNDNVEQIVEPIDITPDEYKKIIDNVADWYYDNYNLTFLGSGTYGSAFRINNEENRVLKITTDLNEAANVSYLVKKVNVKGIAEYYDIHQVDVYSNNEFLVTVYSIIMEKLYSITNVEEHVYMFLLDNYFKNSKGENFKYKTLSKERIGCNWNEFQEINPNRVEEFIDNNKDDRRLRMLDIYEIKSLANIYYEDIMGVFNSVLKYDLVLDDIHGDNIRRTEDDHMKVIDVGGGYDDSNKKFKTKSNKIIINI
jgi:hypothetical protein